MKILYHHRTASKTGQAVHIEELVAAFEKNGHRIIMSETFPVRQRKYGEKNKIASYVRNRMPSLVSELSELAFSLVEFWRLRQAYRKEKPSFLYQRFNLFTLSGVMMKKVYGIPFFLEVNSPLFQERSRYEALSLRRLARWTQETAWRGADMTFPVSEALAAYLRDVGVPDERITVLHNGINTDVFLKEFDGHAEKARLGLEGRTVLGFSGFVHEWHGLDAVLDLMARMPHMPLHFLVVGDGEPRAKLEAKAKDLGLSDRLTFTGVVERKLIPSYVSAFDIALQPGVTGYASPLKMFEYMALGRAIVAPRSPNIEEILTDNVDGLLFTPDDRDSFLQRILELSESEELRRRIGAAARQTVIERDLTWEGNARRIVALAAGEAPVGVAEEYSRLTA